MTAFEQGWTVVKKALKVGNENSCSKCGAFIHFQDEPFWSAGECRECWPEGNDVVGGDYIYVEDAQRLSAECVGCGLAHGTPNSDYCSEECQSQNPTPGVEEVRDLVQRGMEVMPAVQQVARLLGVDGRKLMGAYVEAYR